MLTIPQRLFFVGLVVFCFALNYSTAGFSEPNSLTSTEAQQSVVLEKATESHLVELLIQPFNIFFGFVLGLCGTIFVDSLRKRRNLKEFRKGVQTELKQILAMVNWYTFNLDAELNADKILSFQALIKDFDLLKTLNPPYEKFDCEVYIARDLTTEDIKQIISLRKFKIEQRKQSGEFQSFRILKYTFIQNNISLITLLPLENQTCLLNILRRIEAINEVVPRLDFCFQKSYDSNVTPQNHERLRTVYQRNCQFISDWSYDTAKEIAHFLRQTTI